MDDDHDKFFASFGKAPEFFENLNLLLKADVNVEPDPEEEEKERISEHHLFVIVGGQFDKHQTIVLIVFAP